MTLEALVLHDLDQVERLVPEWTELHESSGTLIPFSAPEWSLTWLRHFCDEKNTPVVVMVRDGARLVGVAPFYRHTMAAGLSRVQPAGTGLEWIGPFEIPAMVTAAGRGRDVARAVVGALCTEEAPWDWANLALGDSAGWLEPEWLPDRSFTSMVRGVVGSVVVGLRVERPEDVLVGRRNLKESIRRAKNRLNGAYGPEGWSVRRAVEPAELSGAFDRLLALHEERSRSEEHRELHSNVFASPRATAFLRDVFGRLAARGRVSIYELVAGERVLAAQLVLRTARASYSSISGIGAEGWPFSPVTYLQWQALRDAHAAGDVELNLSVGPNQAKLRWSGEVRYQPGFVVVGPRTRSRAASTAAGIVSSVRSYREAARALRPAASSPAVAGTSKH